MGFVLEASPLILFAKSGHLRLLQDTVGADAVVPTTVLDEVLLGTGPDARQIEDAFRHAVVEPDVDAMDRFRIQDAGLGAGEAAVLAVARTTGRTAVLDDARARRWARVMGIPRVGTVGLLVRAAREPGVDGVAVFEAVLRAGLRLDAELALAVRRRLEAD